MTNEEVTAAGWQDRAFIGKIAAQVSLPYKKRAEREITRKNGNLQVVFTGTKETGLPYGKYPRLAELFFTSCIQNGSENWDAETNTLSLGSTFRGFMKTIGIESGGKVVAQWREQLERLFACSYLITNDSDTESQGVAFTVARKWRIDWQRKDVEPQDYGLFENYVTLTDEYVQKLKDSPVPVSLDIIALLSRPMSLDIYVWLTRRFSYLSHPSMVRWEQLQQQFGNDTTPTKFKQTFKRALADVLEAYPQAKIVVGKLGITLFPSPTSVPTKAERALMSAESKHKSKEKKRLSIAEIDDILNQFPAPDGAEYVKRRRMIITLDKEGMSVDEIILELAKSL